MAEAREELILEINVSHSVDQLAEMRQEMDLLIKKRQELAEKSIAGDIAATKELEKLNSNLRNIQTEYKAQQRVLDGYSAAQKVSVNTSNLQANSIKTNRDLLKQLTAQYINMKNPSANATSQIKHLTDVLKGQEAAIGNTSRNVGNYKDSIREAFSGLGALSGGFGGASKAALGFGTALATGTGGLSLIIPAIVQFVELISTNAEVADQLSFAMGGINKVFQTFADLAFEGVKRLGFLKNAFNDPIATIKELGKVIVENIVNRFKAFGVAFNSISLALKGEFSAAAKEAMNASLQLTTGVEKLGEKLTGAFESGSKTAQMLDELAGKQIELNGAASIAQKQADALVKSLKDRTKSEEERIKIATRAADLEIKAADLIAKSKQVEIDLEKERLKGITATDEQKNKLRELELDRDLALLEKQNIAAQRQTRINILLDKQSSEEKLKQKNIEHQEALKLLRENAELTLEIQRRTGLSIDEIDEQFANSRLSSFKEFAAKRLKEQDLLDDELKRKIKENQTDQEALKTLRDNAAKQLELQKLSLKTQQELDEEFAASNFRTFEEFYAAKKKLYQDDANNLKKSEEAKQQYQQASLQAASSISNDIIGLVGQVAEAQGAGAEFAKALAFVQILTQQAIAIATAVVGGTQSGAATGPGAIVAIPSFIATLVGAVVAVVGGAIGLLSQPVPQPKFALGGGIDIDGKPHSGGGTPIHVNGRLVAEAEAGEKMFILKKSASEQIGLLSAFNQFFGGRSFTGSRVSHAADGGFIADGGFATREISRTVDNGILLTEAIKQGFLLAPRPELSIVELESRQSSRSRSVSISEA